MEFVVGSLAAVAVWATLGRALPHRDRLVLQRVAAIRGSVDLTRSAGRAQRTSWIAALGRRLPSDRDVIRKSLSKAGVDHRRADSVVAGRYLLAFLGVVLGLLFGPLAPASGIALGFAGYRVLDLVIRTRIRSRRDGAAAAVPDVVDLLAVCTQAGLSLPLALARVAERAPGVLGDELRRTVREIGLGVPRGQALEELGQRNYVPEVQTLVTTLSNAERFGTGVSSSLNTLSSEIRTKRRRRAEEEARRAPVKILFPLVLLILPGFILLTIVPLLLGTFATLGF